MLSPLRVAILSPIPPEANPYTALLCQGLMTAGVKARVYTEPGTQGLPAEAAQADLIHLHWLESWGRPPYRSLPGLTRYGLAGRGLRRLLVPPANSQPVFRRRRQRFLNGFLARLASYGARGGGLVYTVHNLGQHQGEAAGAAIRLEEQALERLLPIVDALHVHNQHLTTVLAERFASLPPLATIPHGYYVGAYPNELSQADARDQLHIPSESFILLFLGMVRPYKGLESLLQAFSELEAPDALLLVAGQPSPPGYADHLAPLAAADRRTRWHLGFVAPEDIQVWMNAADVVVLPYQQITTSGAAMLAWSFGKPIIAPRLEAFTELLEPRPRLGILYDPANPVGLLTALQQARAARQTGQLAAPSEILASIQPFNWQEIGVRFAGLYEDVLARKRDGDA